MENDVINTLKENKVKITSERKAIIDVLFKNKKPLSPADIFLKIKPKLISVNLTTIYRNLEMLEGLNLIKKIGFNKGYFSYELVANRPHHHHVVCRKCKKVEDIENISENFVSQVSEQTQFKLEDHNLEFFGLCQNCQNN